MPLNKESDTVSYSMCIEEGYKSYDYMIDFVPVNQIL